ncbi:uncharacterized protein LOC106156305 [Lingula anatina]|uniref:Uncharacterized protein LOC106156305 n=1 Tax=Lingula anatina TaxID=7574 RepID=A0A1S3HLH3_LINAN|nr:uncharacterized protein LOC106156305 [Lingula anatina]|eukprot:XP_013386953.1 uncharacterized protein LOC106156305 [Lingula anatina]
MTAGMTTESPSTIASAKSQTTTTSVKVTDPVTSKALPTSTVIVTTPKSQETTKAIPSTVIFLTGEVTDTNSAGVQDAIKKLIASTQLGNGTNVDVTFETSPFVTATGEKVTRLSYQVTINGRQVSSSEVGAALQDKSAEEIRAEINHDLPAGLTVYNGDNSTLNAVNPDVTSTSPPSWIEVNWPIVAAIAAGALLVLIAVVAIACRKQRRPQSEKDNLHRMGDFSDTSDYCPNGKAYDNTVFIENEENTLQIPRPTVRS